MATASDQTRHADPSLSSTPGPPLRSTARRPWSTPHSLQATFPHLQITLPPKPAGLIVTGGCTHHSGYFKAPLNTGFKTSVSFFNIVLEAIIKEECSVYNRVPELGKFITVYRSF